MFEWLNGQYVDDKEVIGFNEQTKKLILEDNSEVDIFNPDINHNLGDYENWEEELFNALLRDGRVFIHILSTETGDNWAIEIFRHKTLVNNGEYCEPLVIVNYIVCFCEEVKGDILSLQKKHYAGCQNDEKKLFAKWINKQYEEISEFNNTEMWDTHNAIVTAEFLPKYLEDGKIYAHREEYDILFQLFNGQ